MQLYYKILLQMSDGNHDLIDIANMVDVCAVDIFPAVSDLVNAGLLNVQ